MNASTERTGRTIAAAALALGLAAGARAFDFITDESGIYAVNWQPGTIAMRVMMPAPAFALADGGDYNSAVQDAMQIWNARLGVVQFAPQVRAPGSYRSGNRVNEIVMDSTADGDAFDSQTLAVTLSFSDGANTRTESDIVFNTAFTWDSYRGTRSGHGGREDMRRIAIHELGHVLGLAHPDEASPRQSVSAIMNSRVSDLDDLRTDDINGGQTLYGEPGVIPANDNFANATAINLPGPTLQLTGSIVACTRETGEPGPAGSPTVMTAWWKWTAPSNGSITITTLGSNFDTAVGVYTGSAVNALTQVVANDDVNPGIVRTSTVTFTAATGTTYFIGVGGWDEFYGAVTLNVSFDGTLPPQPPAVVTPPQNATVASGSGATFSVGASGDGPLGYQWLFNGREIAGATQATYSIGAAGPSSAGVYSVRVSNAGGTATSAGATLGVTIAVKLAGTASEVGSNIVHPNGNVYDQVLLGGATASIRADAGQVVRLSYIDLSDDIVQVEFSGAGTLTVSLENPTGPAAPANYSQTVNYMRGHARIVVAGANETTNLLVFSVGRFTAFDPTGAFDPTKPVDAANDPARNGNPIFKVGTAYDGMADIASISILSGNGKFGGLRTSNTSYFATEGLTGVYAPGVEFTGPVFIGDLSAADNARPVILLGAAADVRITGGSLEQANNQPVAISGIAQLKFTAGQNSHGTAQPAQANKARLEQDGVDVTAQVVVVAP